MSRVAKPSIRVEEKGLNLVLLHNLSVNFDLTPSEAVERGLPGNDTRIDDYPPDLWTNGKSGIAGQVTIPLYVLPATRTAFWARRMQSESGIDFGSPAEVAAINSAIRTNSYLELELLWNMYLNDFIALGQSDSSLWRDPQTGKPLAVWLHLNYLPQQPTPSGFYLIQTLAPSPDGDHDLPQEIVCRHALVGAAYVP